MSHLTLRHLECDEIWEFCYAKAKNVPDQYKAEFGYGDVWTWTAIDASTKLVPCWYVGNRDARDAAIFISNLASPLANRVQLTTDGHKPHLEAVEQAFGAEIDRAILIKLCDADPQDKTRYSPGKCTGTEQQVIMGNPDTARISTSYVERQNLAMRMSMRRFTRLAMAAGVADHVWSIEEEELLSYAGGGGPAAEVTRASGFFTVYCRSRRPHDHRVWPRPPVGSVATTGGDDRDAARLPCPQHGAHGSIARRNHRRRRCPPTLRRQCKRRPAIWLRRC